MRERVTLGIGWIYRDYAYLVADTAASSCMPPSEAVSSFGESERGNGGGRVEEAAQKLTVLSPGCALALSTMDIRFAAQLVAFLKTNLSLFDTIEQGLDALEASFGPFEASKSTEFIFAENRAGVPGLVYWNTLGERQRLLEGVLRIGSLTAQVPLAGVDAVMSEYMKNSGRKQDFVQVVSVCMQMLGVHNDFVSEGVGGLFFGLSVRPGGVEWQPDTSYFLYPPALTDDSQMGFISAMERHGFLVVTSSLNPGVTKILALAEDVAASKLELVRHEVMGLKNREAYPLWCFISRRHWRAVIAHVRDGGRAAGFRVRVSSDGTLDMAFHEDFLAALNRVPERPADVPDGAFGFDFSYISIADPSIGWPVGVDATRE